LNNFNSADQEIILGENLTIRQASESESKILDDLKRKWSNIVASKRLLTIQINKDEPESKPDKYLPDARKEIEKVITLLRLFKEESIGFNLIIQRYSDGPHYAFSANALRHYMLWTPPQSDKLGRIYDLNTEQSNGFVEFFSEFDLPTLSSLELSITWFNKSYTEPYPFRDSFIDCIIALENLYLKNTHQELGYKLSLRIAHLLGRNIDQRIEIYKFIKEAYSLRSAIVHGEETKKLKKLNDEYLLRIREILRESIKYFIKNSDNWSGNNLDKIILNGTFAPNHAILSDRNSAALHSHW
jgi:hypothetical protein